MSDTARATARATAFHQLTLLGVSAARIAMHSHAKRAAVDAALTVTAPPLVAASFAAHDLILDQALVLAEFDDKPDLVTELIAVAVSEPDQLAHTAQHLRDERTAQHAWDTPVADLTAAGIPVIDRPGWGGRPPPISTNSLTTKVLGLPPTLTPRARGAPRSWSAPTTGCAWCTCGPTPPRTATPHARPANRLTG